MTDLDIREGVNAITTFDETMLSRVTRFGFEYEMFPWSYRVGHPDFDPGPVPEDLVVPFGYTGGCDCSEACRRAQRMTYWQETQAAKAHKQPLMTGDLLAQRAYDRGLTASPTRHPYHCHCDTCAPLRPGPTMCAQADSSVYIEFVSRILDTNTLDPAEVNAWIELMEEWKADGGWMPDGVVSNGNHVHVSKSGQDSGGDAFTYNEQSAAHRNIVTLYAVFDWTHVADGGCGQIRGYNTKPIPGDYEGSWLSDRGYGTMEHRLWNTPRDPQRLWAHLGLSIALTRWAFGLSTHGVNLGGCNLTNERVKALHRRIEPLQETIARYIPAGDDFDIARVVLGNLAPMK